MRAVPDAPVEVLALDREAFQSLLDESQAFRDTMQNVVQARLDHNQASIDKQNQLDQGHA